MLLKELIEKNRVRFCESFNGWEDAVTASLEPLMLEGAVEQTYVDDVIKCVKKYGPYIVLAPDIALPHSQEGAVGVNCTAVSFMKVKVPVEFEPGNPDKNARLFFALASVDHDEHATNMQKLAGLLLTDGCVEALLKAENEADLLKVDQMLSHL